MWSRLLGTGLIGASKLWVTLRFVRVQVGNGRIDLIAEQELLYPVHGEAEFYKLRYENRQHAHRILNVIEYNLNRIRRAQIERIPKVHERGERQRAHKLRPEEGECDGNHAEVELAELHLQFPLPFLLNAFLEYFDPGEHLNDLDVLEALRNEAHPLLLALHVPLL